MCLCEGGELDGPVQDWLSSGDREAGVSLRLLQARVAPMLQQRADSGLPTSAVVLRLPRTEPGERRERVVGGRHEGKQGEQWLQVAEHGCGTWARGQAKVTARLSGCMQRWDMGRGWGGWEGQLWLW